MNHTYLDIVRLQRGKEQFAVQDERVGMMASQYSALLCRCRQGAAYKRSKASFAFSSLETLFKGVSTIVRKGIIL